MFTPLGAVIGRGGEHEAAIVCVLECHHFLESIDEESELNPPKS